MSLNKEFKQSIIDNQYYYSAFDGKIHDINDLQVCHILSKSKRTLNSIKKAYGCSEETAEILMNMPLLNTVIGTRQDNAEYKKTDDIVYIDSRLINIAYDIVWNNSKYIGFQSKILYDFVCFFDCTVERSLFVFNNLEKYIDDIELKTLESKLFTNFIKDIQYKFHKEIDLHI